MIQISDKKCSTNLYCIFLMLWYQNREVPGRHDIMSVADSRGAHVSKEPRMAKVNASATDMAFAMWNGFVRDARRHARQWRPVEQAHEGSKDVGRRARARSRSSLCKSSSCIFSRSSLSAWVYGATKELLNLINIY